MMRNPNQLREKMAGALPANIMNQMGGMDNIMDMMKQIGGMEKSGQLGGLGDMMKMMQKGGMPGGKRK